MNPITQILQKKLDQSRFIHGFADLTGLLPPPYDHYRFGIVIGRKLDDGIVNGIKKGPNLAYYRHYQDVNCELTQLSENIHYNLKEVGIITKPIRPTLTEEDKKEEYFKTLRLGVSHKMVATRAGLGWIGKTALFISHRWGPRIRLVSLLTNNPVDFSTKPVTKSQCNDCKICVDLCPAKAATGKSWSPKLDRDDFFNPFKCRETCIRLGEEAIDQDATICGICVAVCPIGHRYG